MSCLLLEYFAKEPYVACMFDSTLHGVVEGITFQIQKSAYTKKIKFRLCVHSQLSIHLEKRVKVWKFRETTSGF